MNSNLQVVKVEDQEEEKFKSVWINKLRVSWNRLSTKGFIYLLFKVWVKKFLLTTYFSFLEFSASTKIGIPYENIFSINYSNAQQFHQINHNQCVEEANPWLVKNFITSHKQKLHREQHKANEQKKINDGSSPIRHHHGIPKGTFIVET